MDIKPELNVLWDKITTHVNNIYDNPIVAGAKLLFVKDKLTPDVIDRYNNGSLTVGEICNLSVYEYDHVEKARRVRALNTVAHSVEKGLNMYTCPACKKKNHTMNEKQKRALDEAVTIQCVCLECGKRWNA